MKYIVILAIVFVVMLTAPFVGAVAYCLGKKGSVLQIRQEKTKDARYFGKAFAQLVENNLSTVKGHRIQLSKEEAFVDGDVARYYTDTVDEMVICRTKDFYAPKNVKAFYKEIYGARDIVISGNNVRLRAACARERMILGTGVTVERWVDAEQTLTVYDNCDLGMSAAAGKRLCVGQGCRFHRLYAPEILIGQHPDDLKDPMDGKKPGILEPAGPQPVVKNIKAVGHEMVNEQEEAEISIVTDQDLTIMEGVIVKGDICSRKGVRVCDGAVVCGNLFAEEDVLIGAGAAVLGNVFTQGNIIAEKQAMFGRPGRIRSVVARETITFDKDTAVFGSVSCEGGGSIRPGAGEGGREDMMFLQVT